MVACFKSKLGPVGPKDAELVVVGRVDLERVEEAVAKGGVVGRGQKREPVRRVRITSRHPERLVAGPHGAALGDAAHGHVLVGIQRKGHGTDRAGRVIDKVPRNVAAKGSALDVIC